MDVATLCSQYQKKMWKSMISRKKLDINIWDVIKYKNEKVFYIPYSGNYKFEVTTRFCYKCKKELEIGFRQNEFIVKTCTCSSDNKNFATKEKLITIFSSSYADMILEKFNKYKTRKLPNRINYWIEKGYTRNEAEEKVSAIQKKRSDFSPASKKGARGYSVRTKEFWINRGYTEDEANVKISQTQVTNGLEWYLSRYGGVEGKTRYKKRIKQWLLSYKKALEDDPTINERKLVPICNASKESLKVLLPLFDKYKNDVIIYLGVEESNEYFLRNEKSIYFYDFVIPELKIIVEYNGSKFHPNTQHLSESELKNWKCLFSNETADLVIAKDTTKKKVAEHNGYTVITVWDTDDVDESIQKISNLIQERLNGI
jgi:hypothetical protein